MSLNVLALQQAWSWLPHLHSVVAAAVWMFLSLPLLHYSDSLLSLNTSQIYSVGMSFPPSAKPSSSSNNIANFTVGEIRTISTWKYKLFVGPLLTKYVSKAIILLQLLGLKPQKAWQQLASWIINDKEQSIHILIAADSMMPYHIIYLFAIYFRHFKLW